MGQQIVHSVQTILVNPNFRQSLWQSNNHLGNAKNTFIPDDGYHAHCDLEVLGTHAPLQTTRARRHRRDERDQRHFALKVSKKRKVFSSRADAINHKHNTACGPIDHKVRNFFFFFTSTEVSQMLLSWVIHLLLTFVWCSLQCKAECSCTQRKTPTNLQWMIMLKLWR